MIETNREKAKKNMIICQISPVARVPASAKAPDAVEFTIVLIAFIFLIDYRNKIIL